MLSSQQGAAEDRRLRHAISSLIRLSPAELNCLIDFAAFILGMLIRTHGCSGESSDDKLYLIHSLDRMADGASFRLLVENFLHST